MIYSYFPSFMVFFFYFFLITMLSKYLIFFEYFFSIIFYLYDSFYRKFFFIFFIHVLLNPELNSFYIFTTPQSEWFSALGSTESTRYIFLKIIYFFVFYSYVSATNFFVLKRKLDSFSDLFFFFFIIFCF